MTVRGETASARPRLRCGHCGDIIGVYEPLVLLGNEGERETSIAAEPALSGTSDPCFHRGCFAEVAGLRID